MTTPRLHPHIAKVITFARENFFRDGAEGDTVHTLCDSVEALLADHDTAATPNDFDAYQVAATRTANGLTRDDCLAMCGLGIAGEAGEVADILKKHLFHGHELDRDAILAELGDVLWYIATLADRLGLSLASVADHNVAKLRARYPEGFDAERSKNREGEPFKPGEWPSVELSEPCARASYREARGLPVYFPPEMAAKLNDTGLVRLGPYWHASNMTTVELTEYGRQVAAHHGKPLGTPIPARTATPLSSDDWPANIGDCQSPSAESIREEISRIDHSDRELEPLDDDQAGE